MYGLLFNLDGFVTGPHIIYFLHTTGSQKIIIGKAYCEISCIIKFIRCFNMDFYLSYSIPHLGIRVF